MKVHRTTLGSLAVAAALLLGDAAAAEGQTPARQRDLISQEELELESARSPDLFRAVRILRRHFLEGPRGTRSMGGARVVTRPIVYLNANRMGDATALQNIPTREVAEVRFIPPTEASTRYGMDHGGGVILVRTRNSPPPPDR
jgi:hypothetical protein